MKPLFLVILLCGILACQDDNGVFNASIPAENIRFEARPGGAMMYYTLPDDENIFSMNVRYVDCRGMEVLKGAGYGGDSLLLDGFNEAVSSVPVRVSLVNRNYEESLPVTFSFATEASAPFVFLDNTEVLPSWNGFQLIYKTGNRVSGKFHVFYVGTNPFTQALDTVLVATSAIMQGGDTLLFPLQQNRPQNTVVVCTEDHRGALVKQKVWGNVEAYYPEKLNADQLTFMDVENKSIYSEEDKCDIKYLFDGDLKGEQRARNGQKNTYYTFLAGPNAQGAPFIIDLKKEKIPAQVRIYGILKNRNLQFSNTGETAPIWVSTYENKLPCDVTVYGGNSSDPDGTWVELGTFKQAPKSEQKEWWCLRCASFEYHYPLGELEAADPAYLEIVFPATPITYRYLKLVINDTFDNARGSQNTGKYITMHELEIYVKKEQ